MNTNTSSHSPSSFQYVVNTFSFMSSNKNRMQMVKRIRDPHPHDVLCGRGGYANTHTGNKTFRQWVFERKERYGQEGKKVDKAKIAREILNKVKSLNPPGRFLTRADVKCNGALYWIEIDDTKAMAKTSQALRERTLSNRIVSEESLEENKCKRLKTGESSLTRNLLRISPNGTVNNSAYVFKPFACKSEMQLVQNIGRKKENVSENSVSQTDLPQSKYTSLPLACDKIGTNHVIIDPYYSGSCNHHLKPNQSLPRVHSLTDLTSTPIIPVYTDNRDNNTFSIKDTFENEDDMNGLVGSNTEGDPELSAAFYNNQD